ncbi:hypothetical protein BDB01DRAFT_810006 [Pilobolus umbonatus]|nr:hypothetical protein BDB01DRAFT_810006 [Pilobolus umbonatus]
MEEVGSISVKSKESKQKATIGLRPYFENDKKYVHYLFYSTYYNLVPQTILLRLKSPYILTPWLLIYAILVTLIPESLRSNGDRVVLVARIAVTVLSVLVGVVGLVMYIDKYDITSRVIEGIENDLRDPEQYRQHRGNFWVLTLNDEIVGCVGMDANPDPVYAASLPYIRASERPRAVDAPEIHQAKWKTVAILMAYLDDFIRLILVGVFDVIRDMYLKVYPITEQKKMLFEPHRPHEASVRRLAIKTECQNHGLSTVLLKRVAFWAHSHQMEYLYAETDELQTKMATILVKKHGYQLVSKKKEGLFKTKSLYRLDVKLWMSKELEKRAEETRSEQERKENEELKEYM